MMFYLPVFAILFAATMAAPSASNPATEVSEMVCNGGPNKVGSGHQGFARSPLYTPFSHYNAVPLVDASSAKEEYQELNRELKLLDTALRHLDRLEDSTGSSTTIHSIKCAALSCRYPLEKFLAEIKKYDASLGVQSQFGLARSTKRKIQWTFARKDDIKRLQLYLHTHMGTINILLLHHGFERLDSAEETTRAFNKQVHNQLNAAQGFLTTISNNVMAQMVVVRNVQTMLTDLHRLLCGELRASWDGLCNVAAQVCVSTQQIYTVVLEIRDRLPGPDIRWAHFQEPLLVEDALGRKYPIPSEYEYDLLQAVIEHKFREGPGAKHVSVGNYELCKSNRRSDVITSTSRLLPGMAITMAILLTASKAKTKMDTHCPMPRCPSTKATRCTEGGGWVCSLCGVWYDQVGEPPKRFVDLEDSIDQGEEPNSNAATKAGISGKDEYEALRNIKWVLKFGILPNPTYTQTRELWSCTSAITDRWVPEQD
ncbi:hypothetical protein OPT61_g2286 [Boeremia exigua]|uniref:Uncharacterized protein n=1 Tax=Boeremia exigua TaxID=749465 RepID=A0ACC2IM30_9PLEO|nr:hypothetical protein OPT61_g2286 [Boeremia exigua]